MGARHSENSSFIGRMQPILWNDWSWEDYYTKRLSLIPKTCARVCIQEKIHYNLSAVRHSKKKPSKYDEVC